MGVALRNADNAKYAAPAPTETPPQLVEASPAPFAESGAVSDPAGTPAPLNSTRPAASAAFAPADRALPGQVVPQPWGNVDVMAVYLVDSVDGVQAVQSAFAKNAVVIADPKAVQQQMSKKRDAVDGEEALLIVASNQQIEKSLEDLKKTHTVASVVDEDAVEVARLSGDVQQFFFASLDRYAESAEAVRMQREEKGDVALEGSVRDKPHADAPKQTAPPTPASRNVVLATDAPARQTTALVPELNRDEARQGFNPKPAVTEAIKRGGVKAEFDKEQAKSGSAWRRLIVLVRRSPQPAAAAPAKP